MKLRHWLYYGIMIIILWMSASLMIDNIYILPPPHQVFFDMFSLLENAAFYHAISMTMIRAIIALFMSFFVAFLLAIVALRYSILSDVLSKTILILRSIPNVTYVILLLFWVSRETMVFLVSFLLLFPIIYQNLNEGLMQTTNEWKDVLRIYPQSFATTITKIYLPLMIPFIRSSLISASSLAFKVGIMAEILGQVQSGIGYQIHLSKLDINISMVMAWTLWLLLCVFIFDALIRYLLKLIFDGGIECL